MAIVCGFLIVLLLCLICFFAHKTRSKIWKYGKANIFWDKAPVLQEGPNVEEWVSPGGGLLLALSCAKMSPSPAQPRARSLILPAPRRGVCTPQTLQPGAPGARRYHR